jgi:hypothetical protein
MGDTWHLDEVFVKIQGRQQYLWRAEDEDGDVIDILEPLADVFPLRAAGLRIRVKRVEEGGKARVRHDPTNVTGRGGRFHAGVRWWANNPLSNVSASVNKAVRHE